MTSDDKKLSFKKKCTNTFSCLLDTCVDLVSTKREEPVLCEIDPELILQSKLG
jgi:hypothetical protein